ncbi:hypothetical protein HJG60_010604 [Phyllostomus discolor]|uniref:HTH CENPB-type domain-containing protein n=1 Tax=Phyllostomus discolor TaxID=89673 RepID=A0A834APN2_9CHIR|nr:hypothetical protein HJG60_010604 [Phyllostomus discolor]
MSKQKRISHKIPFKLEVVKHAKEHGNRAAERHFGPLPTEKNDTGMEETGGSTAKNGQNKTMFSWACHKMATVRSGYEWITHHRNNGFSVSTEIIIYEAKRFAAEKGIEDFTGSPSWCHRFMKRCGLALHTKTRITQKKMPIEYDSKIVSFHKFVLDARKKNGFEISQIGTWMKSH